MPSPPSSIDTFLFRLVNRDGGALLDRLAVTVSSRWFGIAAGLSLCGWLLWTRRTGALRALAGLAAALLMSDGVGDRVLRPLLGRVRPCYSLPPGTFRWLTPAANVGSLPSLHAANLFALAVVGTLADRRLAVALYPVAVLVAMSRIYLGVHWPSDVLAGALWGTLSGLAGWAMARRLCPRQARPSRHG